MKPQKIFLVLSWVLFTCISIASLGIGYLGGVRAIGLIGISFLVTIGVAIALGQLIPAGILLSSIIRASFSSFRKAHTPIKAA